MTAMSLTALQALIESNPQQPPIGFIVSKAIYVGLECTIPARPLADALGGLGSVPVVVDPALPDKDFETVFTQEKWLERLAEISARSIRP